jgi:hypothetical protein
LIADKLTTRDGEEAARGRHPSWNASSATQRRRHCRLPDRRLPACLILDLTHRTLNATRCLRRQPLIKQQTSIEQTLM